MQHLTRHIPVIEWIASYRALNTIVPPPIYPPIYAVQRHCHQTNSVITAPVLHEFFTPTHTSNSRRAWFQTFGNRKEFSGYGNNRQPGFVVCLPHLCPFSTIHTFLTYYFLQRRLETMPAFSSSPALQFWLQLCSSSSLREPFLKFSTTFGRMLTRHSRMHTAHISTIHTGGLVGALARWKEAFRLMIGYISRQNHRFFLTNFPQDLRSSRSPNTPTCTSSCRCSTVEWHYSTLFGFSNKKDETRCIPHVI